MGEQKSVYLLGVSGWKWPHDYYKTQLYKQDPNKSYFREKDHQTSLHFWERSNTGNWEQCISVDKPVRPAKITWNYPKVRQSAENFFVCNSQGAIKFCKKWLQMLNDFNFQIFNTSILKTGWKKYNLLLLPQPKPLVTYSRDHRYRN